MLAAVAVLVLLFASPLCALTAALFSARAAHHVLLVAVAAPLLALAFPRRGRLRWRSAGLLHGCVFWLWHAPPLYVVGIGQPAAHWLIRLSLLGSGVWLWRSVLDTREMVGGVLLTLLGSTAQMGMLGALLTFASAPLYAPHLLTTFPFGPSPLEDQQARRA